MAREWQRRVVVNARRGVPLRRGIGDPVKRCIVGVSPHEFHRGTENPAVASIPGIQSVTKGRESDLIRILLHQAGRLVKSGGLQLAEIIAYRSLGRVAHLNGSAQCRFVAIGTWSAAGTCSGSTNVDYVAAAGDVHSSCKGRVQIGVSR